MTTRKCARCGKELGKKQPKFCSRTCSNLTANEKKTKKYKLTCKVCNKTYERVKSKVGKFCSIECTREYQIEASKVKVKCKNCGTKRWLMKSKIRKGEGIFCGTKCYGEYTSKEAQVSRICKECENEFFVTRHHLTKKDRKAEYCSIECFTTYRAKNKSFVSMIEQQFVDELRRVGLDFQHQAKIYKFYVDVLFESKKIVIEFDGDYWHSLPKAKVNDKYRDKVLTNLGYRVIRVKESSYRLDPSKIINEINTLIR